MRVWDKLRQADLTTNLIRIILAALVIFMLVDSNTRFVFDIVHIAVVAVIFLFTFKK